MIITHHFKNKYKVTPNDPRRLKIAENFVVVIFFIGYGKHAQQYCSAVILNRLPDKLTKLASFRFRKIMCS